MGKLESEAKIQHRKGYVQHFVLTAIGVAGVLLVAAAAPNALRLVGGFGRNKHRFAHQARSSLGRLSQKGYIVFEERAGKRYARITEIGKKALLKEAYTYDTLAAIRKRWDRRWRLVMFDIPEKRRKTRDALRAKMGSYGFYRLQDSAWVYPHDCEDLVSLLKADLRLGETVLYLIIEKMENDAHLREHFGIK